VWDGKPTRRPYTSQHPSVGNYVPQPYAYTIDLRNRTLVDATVRAILANPSPHPYIHPYNEPSHYVANLALIFGDARALATLKKTMLDAKARPEARGRAIGVLTENKAAGLAPDLQKLLTDPAARGAALKGLAAYDDPKTPAAIVKVYKSLSADERRDAVQTLGEPSQSPLAARDRFVSEAMRPAS